ncbi:MAG: caspase family protein [Alphaproteobacteria bacterium]|nr:caspase family protein [Alphaproteobacteria bacterium]
MWIRNHWLLPTLVASSLALAPPTFAEPRVALVIGNGAYAAEGKLPNPPNDAKLMARTLRDLGFDVIERIDATQEAMKSAIADFGEKLEKAGKDAVGLFFYAGHGVQSNGRNYLMPVDARIERERDLDIRAVEADWIVSSMQDTRNRVNLVILDACRNNPFARSFRSSARGLAQINAATGMLISYSTAPGSVAADGDGANSPYATALAKAMTAAGAPVTEIFQQVRRDVLAATGGKQTPWESSSLTDNFFFRPGAAPAQAAVPAQPSDSSAMELTFWTSIQGSKNPADYEAYKREYPKGRFVALADNRLAELKPAQTASLPPGPKQAPAPERRFEPLAGEFVVTKATALRQEPLERAKAVHQLTAGDRVKAVRRLADSDWAEVEAARATGYVSLSAIIDVAKAEEADWGRVRSAKASAEISAFLRRYPDGVNVAAATQLRDQLAAAERDAAERAAEEAAKQKAAQAAKAEAERREAAAAAQREAAARAEAEKRTAEGKAAAEAKAKREAEAKAQSVQPPQPQQVAALTPRLDGIWNFFWTGCRENNSDKWIWPDVEVKSGTITKKYSNGAEINFRLNLDGNDLKIEGTFIGNTGIRYSVSGSAKFDTAYVADGKISHYNSGFTRSSCNLTVARRASG